MSLETYVRQRLAHRRVLLMTHLVVGYPSVEENERMLRLMADADVDLVELQMPFSEPVADGPTFVRANQEALARGMAREGYFGFMAQASGRFPFPHLMMGYYNTVFRMGHVEFGRRLRLAGGRGFILPDLPCEEYGDLFAVSQEQGLDPILLMTPTNTEAHLARLGSRARGFVYAVARRGVTGRHTRLEAQTRAFVERCRQATPLPLALGFGLRRGDDLRQLHGLVEIGIVGSALLEEWEQGGEARYGRLLQELSAART